VYKIEQKTQHVARVWARTEMPSVTTPCSSIFHSSDLESVASTKGDSAIGKALETPAQTSLSVPLKMAKKVPHE